MLESEIEKSLSSCETLMTNNRQLASSNITVEKLNRLFPGVHIGILQAVPVIAGLHRSPS